MPHRISGIAKYRLNGLEKEMSNYLLLSDIEMIDISKTRTETNTEKIFNTDTIIGLHIEMIA